VAYRLAPEFRGLQFGQAASSRRSVLAEIVFLSPHSAARTAGLTRIDEPAKPDFYLLDLNGKNLPLKTFKGRMVLVHFFATWCDPCCEELAALNRFLSRSAPNASVVAISVAEVNPRVTRLFEQAPVEFPVLLDRDRTIAKSWKISTLPTTYVLDAHMNLFDPIFVGHDDILGSHLPRILFLAATRSSPAKNGVSSPLRSRCSRAMFDRPMALPPQPNELVLDLRGLRCPQPVLRAKKALRNIPVGGTLIMECTDPLTVIDVPHFVNQTGHTLSAQTRDGELYIFKIVKRH
jgi:TusA-related sulfurtransferase/peroxiredoxin